MQKDSRTRRRPGGFDSGGFTTAENPNGPNSPAANGNTFGQNMGWEAKNGNNGANVQKTLEDARVAAFSKSLSRMIQQQTYDRVSNELNAKKDAAVVAATLDIDPGFKSALNDAFQDQCNAHNFGDIGFVGVKGAIDDTTNAGWYGWNNPFSMFSSSKTTTTNVANNVVGAAGFVGSLGWMGRLGRVFGKLAAPIGTTSAAVHALVSCLSQFNYLYAKKKILFCCHAFGTTCVCAPPLPSFFGLLIDCTNRISYTHL